MINKRAMSVGKLRTAVLDATSIALGKVAASLVAARGVSNNAHTPRSIDVYETSIMWEVYLALLADASLKDYEIRWEMTLGKTTSGQGSPAHLDLWLRRTRTGAITKGGPPTLIEAGDFGSMKIFKDFTRLRHSTLPFASLKQKHELFLFFFRGETIASVGDVYKLLKAKANNKAGKLSSLDISASEKLCRYMTVTEADGTVSPIGYGLIQRY